MTIAEPGPASRSSEADRLRLMLDGVQDHAICLISPSGVVLDWNGGAERLLGHRVDQIVGRHFSCFYTPEDRANGAPARALATAASEGYVGDEGWRIRASGGRFWASSSLTEVRDQAGILIGFAHSIRDITERRVAQEALRESERQFRLLVNGVADHALYMLDPNGIVVSWNAGAERIKGYSADEAIGQHYARFFTDADRKAGLPARGLYEAMRSGRHEVEGWRVRKDGSLFWAQATLYAVKESGTLVGFAKITRDATERQKAQAELQRTQERLFHSQKLEALGQLTGSVAHDFNNLLMIIGGQADALIQRAGKDKSLARAAELIAAATASGAELTRQLLSFSRRQPLKTATVDLAATIGDFRPMLVKSLGNGVKLDLVLPSDLWPVALDPNELELALINLAVNARDAMPQGGCVRIAAANVTLEAGAQPALTGDFVALTISDDGRGIPEDILPQVFDPFFTTKSVGKGTGLGLSHVYGFVTQSGGDVQIDSRLGEGTRVTLRLPRAGEAGADEGSVTAGVILPRVLFVEDNPAVATATSALLEFVGYAVDRVESGEAALETLAKANDYALLLSDIVLCGTIDGIELARRVHENYSDLPVLLVSGYAKDLDVARLEFPVLQKPFEVDELSRAVEAARRAHAASADPKVVRLVRDARPKSRPGEPSDPN